MDAAADRSHETRPRPLSRRRRPRARPLQHLVRAVPALGVGRPRPARHVPRRHRAPALRRRDGLRRRSTCRRSTRSAAPTARARTTRRRRGPDDPGSPWAIGARRGRPQGDPPGARHARGLRALVEAAPSTASRSRSTSPSSARPTTPTSRSTRSGSAQRPDGTIQYAENPPKKYQDIYPFDFESAGLARAVGGAARRLPLLDRPGRARSSASTTRTPSRSPFWEWLIARGQARRIPTCSSWPRRSRARRSCTAWPSSASPSRTPTSPGATTKRELTEYFTELTHDRRSASSSARTSGPTRRTSCPSTCSTAAAPAFVVRLVLAATLGASYGIYGPAFELREHAAARAGQRGVPRLGEVPAPPLGPRRAGQPARR